MDQALNEPLTYSVTCEPAGRIIEVRDNESILAGAMRAGLTLSHSCKNGVCGTCKAKVLSGVVDHGQYQPGALPDAERDQGFTLLCQAMPQSAVVVECLSLIHI